MPLYADVALPLPLRREFTYLVPPALEDSVRVGARVRVVFGRRRAVGVVTGLKDRCSLDPSKVRPIHSLVDHAPVVPGDIMALCRRIAKRTLCSVGEALDAAIPGALKHHAARNIPYAVLKKRGPELEKELAALEEKERFRKQARVLRAVLEAGGEMRVFDLLSRTKVSRSPLESLVKRGLLRLESRPSRPELEFTGDPGSVGEIPELTGEQERCVDRIRSALDGGEYQGFLLYGVTGSGKTEVYLRAVAETLARRRTAVVLVPEISLTPQTVARFRARFGKVAVLHSSLTGAQRADQWRLLLEGRRAVAVGPRSALFAPLDRLGLIVVDEEHENTFKQGNVPRYHARDMALERARICGAVAILGSATPSLESWKAAREGKLELLELPSRVGGGRIPQTVIVDMRREKKGPGGMPFLSRVLVNIMRDRLKRGEQVILFLNRRGFAPVLTCRRCGISVRCKECSVPMTFHRSRRRLVCHYCAGEISPPEKCPECGWPELYYLGFGTERVEGEVRRIFPEYPVVRMDSDTMARRDEVGRALQAFRKGEFRILVGTQMIAKGLDFPRVTVVGVISADTSLLLPDFRAAERTFQLVAQVAGRAGRGDAPGVVVVQTLVPDHPAVVEAAKHDFRSFAAFELAQRKERGFPPFGRIARIVLEGKDEEKTAQAAGKVGEELREAGRGGAFQVLGPARAPLERIQGRWRFHVLALIPPATTEDDLERLLPPIVEKKRAGLRVLLDMDPATVL
ncbi:MAG TPA: primosomal protein N' [Planctomycetes bacterium]|nr:primosomal protein N' [Planctomycetota bacterium]